MHGDSLIPLTVYSDVLLYVLCVRGNAVSSFAFFLFWLFGWWFSSSFLWGTGSSSCVPILLAVLNQNGTIKSTTRTNQANENRTNNKTHSFGHHSAPWKRFDMTLGQDFLATSLPDLFKIYQDPQIGGWTLNCPAQTYRKKFTAISTAIPTVILCEVTLPANTVQASWAYGVVYTKSPPLLPCKSPSSWQFSAQMRRLVKVSVSWLRTRSSEAEG